MPQTARVVVPSLGGSADSSLYFIKSSSELAPDAHPHMSARTPA
jgi:hypothetical protein